MEAAELSGKGIPYLILLLHTKQLLITLAKSYIRTFSTKKNSIKSTRSIFICLFPMCKLRNFMFSHKQQQQETTFYKEVLENSFRENFYFFQREKLFQSATESILKINIFFEVKKEYGDFILIKQVDFDSWQPFLSLSTIQIIS